MSDMQDLLVIMARLRDPEQGCPWDREQTYASLLPHTLEEVFEVIDAVERESVTELCDELGDLLFQIVFYARIAEEAGQFDFAAIVSAICDKLVRRHPHVFADARINTAAEQSLAWEQHKAAERRAAAGSLPGSLLADVALTLPALSRAIKLQRRAAQVGFDWQRPEQVLAKVAEELDEVREVIVSAGSQERLQHEIGDLLLAASNLARHVQVDPEQALRQANQRFCDRFQFIERHAQSRGIDLTELSLAEMETLWQSAKQQSEPTTE